MNAVTIDNCLPFHFLLCGLYFLTDIFFLQKGFVMKKIKCSIKKAQNLLTFGAHMLGIVTCTCTCK